MRVGWARDRVMIKIWNPRWFWFSPIFSVFKSV